ncbi:hypothetical protein CEXT_663731 [Caerostris extrusa]|uniref:Uncharacterized protein n=1 Tax=Caerostris extrusa TaxID=172846 RepID=A0AAV4X0B7_CAEEX|nr:hypothetical protein CEXT_663731 [Caerostris extrusa]
MLFVGDVIPMEKQQTAVKGDDRRNTEQGEDVICWEMLFPWRSSRQQWKATTEETFSITQYSFDSKFRQSKAKMLFVGRCYSHGEAADSRERRRQRKV